jgi:ribose 5-phosphate isomerase A
LCERRLLALGCRPTAARQDGRLFVSDNGNNILDCEVQPISDAAQLQSDIRSIPGVVDTGLFLGMAEIVLVGDAAGERLVEERRRRDPVSPDYS